MDAYLVTDADLEEQLTWMINQDMKFVVDDYDEDNYMAGVLAASFHGSGDPAAFANAIQDSNPNSLASHESEDPTQISFDILDEFPLPPPLMDGTIDPACLSGSSGGVSPIPYLSSSTSSFHSAEAGSSNDSYLSVSPSDVEGGPHSRPSAQYVRSAPPSPSFTAMFNNMAIGSNDHGGNPPGHSRDWRSDDYGHLTLPDATIPMRRSASESSRHAPRRPDSDFASRPAESSPHHHQQQQARGLSRSSSRTRHRRSVVDSEGDATRIVKKKVVASRNIKAASEQRRVHEARFNCDVEDCESTFTTRSKLGRHLDAHEGIKAYPCTIEGCDRSFSSASDRRRHEMTSKMHRLHQIQTGDPRCFIG